MNRRAWLCIAPAVSLTCDVTVTLMGQADRYWQGEYDQAIRCFRKAIKIRPVLTDGHYNLGKSLHKQGRLGEALDAYGRARKLDSQRSDVRESLGRALLQAGKIAEAHREYSEFARDLPDDPVAAGCLALTAALVEGRPSAQAVYDRAIPRFPLDDRLRWGYARFLLSTGRFAQGWQAERCGIRATAVA